ncbi:MAG: FHA domain-containing protein [Thermostichus sp. HHBFW_bins_43]
MLLLGVNVAPLDKESDTQGQRRQVRHVLVVEDTKGRRTISLEAATYSIGRDPASAILLNSNFVSRQHAILLRMPGPRGKGYQFRIIDGNLEGKRSTNGITVNGHRVQAHDLAHGDIIIFSSDVTAGYYASANLTDEEFDRYTERVDFRSVKAEISDPHRTRLERSSKG